MFSVGSVSSFLILFLFPFLPFFEGGETPTGLFLFHSLILLCFAAHIMTSSRMAVPRFVLYFLPFLAALLISTLIAPYKYAAVLQLLDYVMAGIFTITVFGILHENQDKIETIGMIAFCTCAAGTLISLLFQQTPRLVRISGTFVSPNDFAAFCLLLTLLGLFLYERETNSKRRIGLILFVASLVVCIALSSSRSIFLACAIFLAVYLWKKGPSFKRIIAVVTIIVLMGTAVFVRFSTAHDRLRYYRLKIWKHSLIGILSDPYLGIGLNMLHYKASKFNFPADVEVGRFARIARSADNQYLQILAETGFLGFLTFLVGWGAIGWAAYRVPQRFFFLASGFPVVTIISFFSLPLNNTSIFFLFLFIILIPLPFLQRQPPIIIRLNSARRIALPVLLFLLFVFGIFFPYAADYQFHAALRTADPGQAQQHLNNALRYNPFQPYYRFVLARRLIDRSPKLDPARWLYLAEIMNESISLNPLEPDFYRYKARIYHKLLDDTRKFIFYTQAVSAYQAAIDRDPFNVFLRAEFASFLIEERRLDLAQAELEKALELEPAYLNARLLLAEVKYREKKLDEARIEFENHERLYEKYRTLPQRAEPDYVRALLFVNSKYKSELKKLLF